MITSWFNCGLGGPYPSSPIPVEAIGAALVAEPHTQAVLPGFSDLPSFTRQGLAEQPRSFI